VRRPPAALRPSAHLSSNSLAERGSDQCRIDLATLLRSARRGDALPWYNPWWRRRPLRPVLSGRGGARTATHHAGGLLPACCTERARRRRHARWTPTGGATWATSEAAHRTQLGHPLSPSRVHHEGPLRGGSRGAGCHPLPPSCVHHEGPLRGSSR